MMEDKIRRHVEGLFEQTAPTKKAVELQEEMIQNLNDKYKDLMSEGKTPEAAYNIAIAGIGDISSLLAQFEVDTMYYDEEEDIYISEAAQRKSAMLTAIAVMMYILCVLPLIILAIAGSQFVTSIGVPLMFLMVAAATGLLIYNSMTRPKYGRGPDSMVEDFREWQSDKHDRKAMRRAISSALWSITLVVYFIVSFVTFAWHVTWIIFIVGAAIESIINIFMKK